MPPKRQKTTKKGGKQSPKANSPKANKNASKSPEGSQSHRQPATGSNFEVQPNAETSTLSEQQLSEHSKEEVKGEEKHESMVHDKHHSGRGTPHVDIQLAPQKEDSKHEVEIIKEESADVVQETLEPFKKKENSNIKDKMSQISHQATLEDNDQQYQEISGKMKEEVDQAQKREEMRQNLSQSIDSRRSILQEQEDLLSKEFTNLNLSCENYQNQEQKLQEILKVINSMNFSKKEIDKEHKIDFSDLVDELEQLTNKQSQLQSQVNSKIEQVEIFKKKVEKEKEEEQNALYESEKLIKSQEYDKAEQILGKVINHYIDEKFSQQNQVSFLDLKILQIKELKKAQEEKKAQDQQKKQQEQVEQQRQKEEQERLKQEQQKKQEEEKLKLQEEQKKKEEEAKEKERIQQEQEKEVERARLQEQQQRELEAQEKERAEQSKVQQKQQPTQQIQSQIPEVKKRQESEDFSERNQEVNKLNKSQKKDQDNNDNMTMIIVGLAAIGALGFIAFKMLAK